MNKSKIRIICIVMVLTMAVLGVVAFADGTQKSREISAQNEVSVDIQQNEYERCDQGSLSLSQNNLQTFSQNQALLPAKYENNNWTEDSGTGLWTDVENARDKIVTVTNCGEGSVYFRTIVAMEADRTGFDNLIKMNLNTGGYYWNQEGNDEGIDVIEDVYIDYTYDPYPDNSTVETATIRGVYDIIVGTYREKLAAGTTSAASLLQVAMHKNAEIQQIQQFGPTYEILVWSQAAAAGDESDPVTALAAKFGIISYDNHPWKQFNALEDSSKTAAADTDDNTSSNDDN